MTSDGQEQEATLYHILLVEKVIKEADSSLCTIPQIKRALPEKIDHKVLMEVLNYLEKSNKVTRTKKGVTWIFNPELVSKYLNWPDLEA